MLRNHLLVLLTLVGVQAASVTNQDAKHCTARGGCDCDCSWATSSTCNHDDGSCCWGCCCSAPSPPPSPGGWQYLNSAIMTHYWDCCKFSCSWPGAGTDNTGGAVAKTCGGGQNDHSSCNGGPDYACTDYLPWVEGDTLYGWVANAYTGNNADCGTCFELQVEGAGNGVTRAVVQLSNKGGMGSDQHGKAVFDFLVPGGGFGQHTGCSPVPGWKVYTNQGGPCNPSSDTSQCKVYGGFTDASLCDSAFSGDQAAKDSCRNVLFGVFPSGGPPGNPIIKARRVMACPSSLSSKSGMDGINGQTTNDWNGFSNATVSWVV